MKKISIVKSVVGSILISCSIISGTCLIIFGFKFWGYFLSLFGYLMVYFLCIQFFQTQELSSKEEIKSKGGKS